MSKTEQPPAGEFTAKIRKRWLAEALHQDSTLDYAICAIIDLCTRLDRSEASRKELLTALKELAATFVGLPEGSIGGQAMKKAIDAIAKAKKEVKK